MIGIILSIKKIAVILFILLQFVVLVVLASDQELNSRLLALALAVEISLALAVAVKGVVVLHQSRRAHDSSDEHLIEIVDGTFGDKKARVMATWVMNTLAFAISGYMIYEDRGMRVLGMLYGGSLLICLLPPWPKSGRKT